MRLYDEHISQPARWKDIEFWRALCPELSLSEGVFVCESSRPYDMRTQDVAAAVNQVAREGYFQLPPVVPAKETSALRTCIGRLIDAGFPAVFILLYDEPWMLMSGLGRVLEPILGDGYRLTDDAWVYYIRAIAEAPSQFKEESGWAPHRDGFPTVDTLREDGRPRVLNVWIALDDISREQSCIHLLPTHCDPNYPSNLRDISIADHVRQHVKALPVAAGSVLGWGEYTLHWGGRPRPSAAEPRVSIAIRYQSLDITCEHPTYRDRHPDLDFHNRLGIVASSVQRYRARFACPEPLRTFCAEQAKLHFAVQMIKKLNSHPGGIHSAATVNAA